MTDIMLGIGAAGVITGTIIYFVSRKKQKNAFESANPTSSIRSEPQFSSTHVGGELTVGF